MLRSASRRLAALRSVSQQAASGGFDAHGTAVSAVHTAHSSAALTREAQMAGRPVTAAAGSMQGRHCAVAPLPCFSTVAAASAPISEDGLNAPTQSTRRLGAKPDADMRSLLRLPFVGPKNAALLTTGGFRSADELTKKFADDCQGDVRQMENKLRAAGLRNRLHVAGIARAAKCMHDGFDPALMLTGAMFADSAGDAPNDVTICVEGNISAGKSTFLEAVKATPFGQNNLRIVPEPVERWTAVQAHVGDTAGLAGLSDGAKELNILQKFYENSDRWAYTFQSWVFFTRFMQERDSNAAWNAAVAAQSAATNPRGRRGGRATAASRSAAAAAAAFMTPPPAVQHRLMERSVFSDRMVFVEALKGDGKLSPLEAAIYDQWFTFMLQDRPSLVPDAFIYLRASPEVCQRRMKLRGRAEESPVKIDYLSLLHEKHDNWFTLRSKQDGAAYGNLSGASGAVHSGTGSLVWKEKGREGELATWVGSSLQMRAQQGQDASSGGWDDVAAAVRDATYGLLPPSLHGKVQFLDLGQALGGASASACKLPANAQRRVPALVLDCDDANLVSSEDDKKYYGDMVKEFYSYVENLKLQVWTPMRRFAAGNAASGLGGGNTADDEAEVNAERERMRQRMEALCASFTRRGGASTSSGGVVLPTPAQTAVLGSKMAMRG